MCGASRGMPRVGRVEHCSAVASASGLPADERPNHTTTLSQKALRRLRADATPTEALVVGPSIRTRARSAGVEHQPQGEQRAIGAFVLGVSA